MEEGVYRQFYRMEERHWWFAGMRTVCRDLLEDLPRGNDGEPTRCLDLGSGTGLWTKELASFGRAWGLDVAPEALYFSGKRGLDRLVRATVEQMPFKPESFGLITALGLIEHLSDEKRFLAELMRVCSPGGHVLLLTSAYGFLWSRHDEIVHHKRRYTKARLTRLVNMSGFEVVRSSYVNTLLFLPIVAVRLVQRLKGARAAPGHGSPDVFMPAALLNRVLYALLWAEAKLLRLFSFPAGVGLFVIMCKPEAERDV